MKICSKCGVKTNRTSKTMCLSCYRKQYYQENKERALNQSKERYNENKEKINKKTLENYYKNKKYKLTQQKEYVNNNKEKVLQRQKDYYQKNKEEINENHREYYWIMDNWEQDKIRHAKLKGLGYKPINRPWKGCSGHHLNHNDVLYIPKEIHFKYWHSLKYTDKIKKVNDLSFEWWNNRLILIQGVLNGIH